MNKSKNLSNRCLSQSTSLSLKRRDFLKSLSLLAGGLTVSRYAVMAGPFNVKDLNLSVPVDKKLSENWIKSLYERGVPAIYKGKELDYIGMPIGGICTGQVYLGGDGRLWRWDIFNEKQATGDHNYAYPPVPDYPLEQGFSLTIDNKSYSIDRNGFTKVLFKGQYPIGEVYYQDDSIPVDIKLEAFSPFIPLASDDSGLPATIMQFTVKNNSTNKIEANINGMLENAVCLNNRNAAGNRINKIIKSDGFTFLECSVKKEDITANPRPDNTFEDWNKASYTNWKTEGTAFGNGPIKKTDIPSYVGDVGGDTENVVNSHATAPGLSVSEKDASTGKLTSNSFTIDRNYINFWIGGGSHKGQTCFNLIVKNKVLRTTTGNNSNQMTLQSFFVKDLIGKEAHFEIVDSFNGEWGNIGIGKISFSDREATSVLIENLPDFGSMGLALMGDPAEIVENLNSNVPITTKSTGTLGRKLTIAPGKSVKVSFLITWFFPNLSDNKIGQGRYYANRFDSAYSVAKYITSNFNRLTSLTNLWRDTWYDTSLPFWFLDRTFINTSTLATSTAYRYKSGRFWAWEGVGCCAGTCTHVWHYAQAMARIFPDIERDVRQRVDLGLSLNLNSGVSGFRAEYDLGFAVDGQSGTILRIYREHQMSRDDNFLRSNWNNIKLMFSPLFKLDLNGDGILEGGQMNTLDRPWYGKISWLSSIYLAALRAGEAMATEMGENDFATRCREIVEYGSINIDKQLFNGEYYYQIGDSGRLNEVGSYDGCEIDQVLGQSWTFQVGLERVLNKINTRTALESLWKYNFALDAGLYRNQLGSGRVYAMEGEAGLLMCTWPKGDSKRVKVSYDYYFNECMTGFEYQVAGHMIWEGMLCKGLAITKAIHDRYHASKRNPWNEVECGDHYARAMASYGVFIAICGFEYHGPKQMIGFAPKITPENFKAAFTSAEGWGHYTQSRTVDNQHCKIILKYGKLKIKTLKFDLVEGINSDSVNVVLIFKGITVKQSHKLEGKKLLITIDLPSIIINEKSAIDVDINYKLSTFSLPENQIK